MKNNKIKIKIKIKIKRSKKLKKNLSYRIQLI